MGICNVSPTAPWPRETVYLDISLKNDNVAFMYAKWPVNVVKKKKIIKKITYVDVD